jgi:hypothetical protein
VRRDFPTETVALNLHTGRYFGLNETAAAMLDALAELGDVDAAADRLAAEYAVVRDTVRSDLAQLCRELCARGIVEIDDDTS